MNDRITDERLRELATWEPGAKTSALSAQRAEWIAMARELAELRERVHWRPMEEAPKDGTRVLLRFLDQTIIGRWADNWGTWQGLGVRWYDGMQPCNDLRDGWGKGGPTAWMPLPGGDV